MYDIVPCGIDNNTHARVNGVTCPTRILQSPVVIIGICASESNHSPALEMFLELVFKIRTLGSEKTIRVKQQTKKAGSFLRFVTLIAVEKYYLGDWLVNNEMSTKWLIFRILIRPEYLEFDIPTRTDESPGGPSITHLY